MKCKNELKCDVVAISLENQGNECRKRKKKRKIDSNEMKTDLNWFLIQCYSLRFINETNKSSLIQL